MTRNLTCIVCPKGCALTVELENAEVKSVTGNTCPRGKAYAVNECTHPMRTVTSTVRATTGEVVPVKTSQPIPKELMSACMKELNRASLALPVRIGDVVIQNLLGTGADVVVTANREA